MYESMALKAASEGLKISSGYVSDFITALVVGGIMALILLYQDRRDWKASKFGKRVNISLNIINENTLHIRTLMEAQVVSVFLSSYARSLVKKAAKKTTVKDPFLNFPTEQDEWMVYNEILNAVSSLCAQDFLKATVRGAEFAEEPFLMAITWERDSEARVQKLRVLLVQESTLREFGEQHKNGNHTAVEVPSHESRLTTLLHLHEKLENNEWPPYKRLFLPRV